MAAGWQSLHDAGSPASWRPPLVEDSLAAVATDPGAPVRPRLPIGEDRDCPVHPDPPFAMAMLEARGLFTQNPELSAVLHPDLRATSSG